MNLSKNLYYLRKRDKITQEELAERLGVSRQSVSKWETGEAYPEMEKLVALCDLYHITLDELVKNDLTASENAENGENPKEAASNTDAFISHMNAFSVKISLGVFLVLFGLACCVAIGALSQGLPHEGLVASIGAAVFLLFIAAAVFLFVFAGLSHEKFRKENPVMENTLPQDQINRFSKRFAIAMACLVSAVILDVVILILITSLIEAETIFVPNKEQALALCAAVFLLILSFIVGGFTYFGIQHSKYYVSEYNKENERENAKRSEWVDGVCGVIMMTAAAVYLVLGFVWNLWHPGWVIFPVGGILCGIVSTLFKKKS